MGTNIGNLILGEKVVCVVPLRDNDVFALSSLGGADIIELRVDMFMDVTEESLKISFIEAKDKFKRPIIATCRASEEGGKRKLPDDERLLIYNLIAEDSDAMDVEIESSIASDVVGICESYRIPVIGSFHNFNMTPSIETLEAIFSKGKDIGFDIIKIAVMPVNLSDIRILTQFTLNHQDEAIITIAMGDLGRVTRLFYPMLGSLLTYASVKTTTAPGQFTIREMRELIPNSLKYS